MDLNQNNKIIAIVAVVAIVAASALGIWFFAKDPAEGESGNANDIANIFAEMYEGKFGEYSVAGGATAEKAIVESPTGASQSPFARITFTITNEVSAEFATLKDKVEDTPSMMGAAPTEIEDLEGFDNIVAYRLDPSMMGNNFTMIYFVAYIGDVLIDGSNNPVYNKGSAASDEAVMHFFKKVSDAAKGAGAIDSVNYAYRFSNMYEGAFGEYSIADNSTAEKATVEAPTGASQSPYARMSFTITDNASAEFTTLKDKVEATPGVMGAVPVEIEDLEGFDGIVAYRLDPSMMGSNFTMIYFAAYVGDVLIDGSNNPVYHKGSVASDGTVAYFFKKVSDTAKGLKTLDAMDYAYMFSNAYVGAFGEYSIADNSTTDKATAEAPTGASQSPFARLAFSITDDASAEFTTLKDVVENKPSMMGAAPVEIEDLEGFDGIVAYRLDPSMMGSNFTMIYFAAYSGDVLVDGSINPIYHAGSAASIETIELFFETLSGIIQ